jgi:N-acetylglucosaminyldiphosphoundecaprenol N-acetyl-beta-D-mannosaminyltransferase
MPSDQAAAAGTILRKRGSKQHLAFRHMPRVILGGLPIAALNRDETAKLIVESGLRRRRGDRPLIFTSANGEVMSRVASDRVIAGLFCEADLISADGQSLVFMSRWLCSKALPMRVSTTDLFHDAARHAVRMGATFYLLGALEEENRRAFERVSEIHPGLRIVGRSHGYLAGDALIRLVAEINALAPDILWVSLGMPREQLFCSRFATALPNVGAIKTSGGLFNFLSGTRKRAPGWMQSIGMEWVFRILQEPRRLWWRYASTNPHALFLLLTRSG